MEYNVKMLKSKEVALAKEMQQHFLEFFQDPEYDSSSRKVASLDVASPNDADNIYYGEGMYLILTDYQFAENPCTYVRDGMKVIYRGQCCKVKSRIRSHLFNSQYRSALPERGVRFDVCLKLDGKNGVNIEEAPYNKFRWRVVVHKMRNSSKMIREQAESAFDEVFSKPLGSKEVNAKKIGASV